MISSYTMLTINADDHPLMSHMHRPNPKLPPDRQDKRSVISIEPGDVEAWVQGSVDDARELLLAPLVDVMEAAPKG